MYIMITSYGLEHAVLQIYKDSIDIMLLVKTLITTTTNNNISTNLWFSEPSDFPH